MKSDPLLATIAAVVLAGCVGSASGPADPPGQATVAGPRLAKRVGGLEPRQVVALFGANGLEGVPDRVLVNYRRVFGFGDADNDGRHSKKEYVNDGLYLTLRARQGIFRAADSDNDGFVTEAEYVENRVITDEAKEIFHDMDADGDGRLTAGELEGSGRLKDRALARAVFKALDTDGNGELVIPEYLRVWGRWARSQASR